MGNQASNSSASISVATEKTSYVAGEQINGYVQVSIIESTACSKLYVQIFGETRTQVGYTVTRTDGEGNSHTERRWDYGEETLIDTTIHIAEFPSNEIEPGSYQFQFSYDLPTDLPSSCTIAHGDDRASITYTAKVKMERPGFMKRDLAHTVYLDVASAPHKAQENVRVEDESSVMYFCCINKGKMQLSSVLGSSNFHPSDEIPLEYDLNNNSTQPVEEVRIQLVEEVSISAGWHSENYSKTLWEEKEEGIGPMTGFGHDFGTEPRKFKIILPEESCLKHSTLHSRLLQISHKLVVEAHTGCCISNPTVETPIFLERKNKFEVAEEDLIKRDDEKDQEELPVAYPVTYAPDPSQVNSPYQVNAAYGKLQY